MESTSDAVPESSRGASGITPEILQNIAFSIAGILILIDTLPLLGQMIIESVNRNPMRNLLFWFHLVESLIRLALGSWLLFGSESVQKFKSRFLDNAAHLLDKVVHKDW